MHKLPKENGKMDRIIDGGPVKSSHIADVLWTNDGLVIVFNDGSKYGYPDASRATFSRLYNARSVGGYFAANIRGMYKYVQIE